ncbi:MAG: VWA domain-containing protein [Neomegalonema sp.]|nr:VWA domain-containing protein [Neomegalonema sp.]
MGKHGFGKSFREDAMRNRFLPPGHRFLSAAWALIAVLLAALMMTVPAAAADRPLLVEGTQTIYLRVLTKPEASLHSSPGGPVAGELWPLQPVYVYAEQGGWYQVGRSLQKGPEGWIEQEASVPWLHNIVGAFASRGSRERQLFLKDHDALERLLNHETMPEMAQRMRIAAQADAAAPEGSEAQLDPAWGVLNIEPDEQVDINERFYLMPMLSFDETRHPLSLRKMLAMELASLPLGAPSEEGGGTQARIGVVFVVDTTQSMQPFIDKALEAVRVFIGLTEQDEGLKGRVDIGVVGYRDDPSWRKTQYRTKVFTPLEFGKGAAPAMQGLAAMQAMEGSSRGFTEDSVAGLDQAIQKTEWERPGAFDFAGRLVVVISDAGPKQLGDRYAQFPNKGAEYVRQIANAARVGVASIHIKAPSGRDNHEEAERQYRAMSRYLQESTELYYPVHAEDPQVFSDNINRAMLQLLGAVTGIDTSAQQAQLRTEAGHAPDATPVGLAMRMAYLGRVTGREAPSILKGWTVDTSFENARAEAIEPRLLVTRNQLSTMTEMMQRIIDLSDQSIASGSEDGFFDTLRDTVTGMAGDPNRLASQSFSTLGGVIAEFLERLPTYVRQTPIMAVTEHEWNNSPQLRTSVRENLKEKIEIYREFYTTGTLWTKLYDGQPDGEWVFAMPFDALP